MRGLCAEMFLTGSSYVEQKMAIAKCVKIVAQQVDTIVQLEDVF